MGTKGCNIIFEEDEEDYLDDPIKLLDFEEETVFCASDFFLKNLTIEDPGYVISTSVEDYEIRPKQSLLQLEKFTKQTESSLCANNSFNLLSKCRSCCIKVVDCNKFPWYYRNKLANTNKTRYNNTENNVIEIYEDEEEMIVDLTEEKEHAICNKQDEDSTRDINKEIVGKVIKGPKKLTGIESSFNVEVIKQTCKSLPNPVYNNLKPTSNEEEDLIIHTYTRIIDKTIQKLKSNIESSPNSKNLSNNLDNKLLLGSKSCVKNRDNLLPVTTNMNTPRLKTVTESKDNNNNDKIHIKKKNSKKFNKIKNIYTSVQISKTKIKIKKHLLKCKETGSVKNDCKKYEDIEQYDSLKMIENKHNSFRNEEQPNHIENKHRSIKSNSTQKCNSMYNSNIRPDRSYGCNKPLFNADRIIPHFHDNIFIHQPNLVSKTESKTKYRNRAKETVHSYEAKRFESSFYSTETLNMGHIMSETPNFIRHQRICDFGIRNNHTMANINKPHNNNLNTKVNFSNILATQPVKTLYPSQSTYELPKNNEIKFKKSINASKDVIKSVNNDFFMRQIKKNAAKLEEERPRYLLPSNCY